jgi:hypothetical protein
MLLFGLKEGLSMLALGETDELPPPRALPYQEDLRSFLPRLEGGRSSKLPKAVVCVPISCD